MISFSANVARAKYGPRNRKQIQPKGKASNADATGPRASPHHADISSLCMRRAATYSRPIQKRLQLRKALDPYTRISDSTLFQLRPIGGRGSADADNKGPRSAKGRPREPRAAAIDRSIDSWLYTPVRPFKPRGRNTRTSTKMTRPIKSSNSIPM